MGRKLKFDDWSDETIERVHNLLDFYRLAALKGENRLREMYTLQPLDWIKANADYWKNVQSGLAWVQSLIPQHKELPHGGEQGGQDRNRREESPDDSETVGRVNNGNGPVDR